MPLNIRAKPAQNKLSAASSSGGHADGNASHSRFSKSAKQGKGKQAKTTSTPSCRSGLEPGSVSTPVSKVPRGQGSMLRLGPEKPAAETHAKETSGSATASRGKTLSMENIQSLNAAYGTSGVYSCDRDILQSSGGYPRGTMTLGRNTSRFSYSGRCTGAGSSPDINSTDLNHRSNHYGKEPNFRPAGTSSLQHHSGRRLQALDSAGRRDPPASDLQDQLRELQRENDNLRRELDGRRDGRTGHGVNNPNFWSPDVNRDKSLRREDGERTPALKDYDGADQDTGQIEVPLTVRELQEELRAHRELNTRLQQGTCRDSRMDLDHKGGLSPGYSLRESPSNLHSPGPKNSPRASPSNTYDPGPREADVIVHSSGYSCGGPVATQRVSPAGTPHPGPKRSPTVPRSSNSLRPCSPCQVPGCDGFSSPPLDPSHENFVHLQSEHERQAKELSLLRRTMEEMETRIDSQKQTLGARDESIQRLLEMLQSQGQVHGQWGRGHRTGILAMVAQETEAQLENMHVREIENLLEQLKDKDKQLTGLKDRVQGLQTDSSNTDTALATLEEALSEKERVIENLREQKERADRVQLEELERLWKDNQELKDKLTALQPPKLSPGQPPILGPNQSLRPDGEMPATMDALPAVSSTAQNPEDTLRKCPDIADRLKLLEQEVARYREESGKSQAEVTRLMVALKNAEMDRSGKEKRINDLEREIKSPHIQKQMVPCEKRKDAQPDGHPHSLSQLEELIGALEKTRQELDATKLHLASTQQTLHEQDGHLSSLRQERRKQLEEILEMKQQALLAAISEKDANIALLELSPSKRRKAQEEVMALKREKDRLMHQLKQQTQSRMKMMADNYEEDCNKRQHHPHHSLHLHSASIHHRRLPRGPPHANHRLPVDQEDEEGIWA
ncbi:ERC protein 2-like isoform X10 [Syngnathoides biaculeatus]|uniref:ERC protein 2-like isoform X10 n=1 Tax=Syngnathoides biaculeatus TaxID=300417 RepID=UPI002ADE9394|nr:ERC protein 2-like isoform X10 [Syngnathoides biaculeatus]